MNRFERWIFDSTQVQLAIVTKVVAWNPYAFFSKGEEERAGGLYGRSYDGSGRRGSETPMPVADDGGCKDPHDRDINRQNNQWITTAREIDRLADVNLQRERDRGTQLDPEAARRLAEAESANGGCTECGTTTNVGRSAVGLCGACYQREYRARKREAT